MTTTFRRLAVTVCAWLVPMALPAQQPFTIEQVMSAPFPDELTAAPAGGAVAWVSNARGVRNIWVAAPPDYAGRVVTAYAGDDGQEMGELHWTPDARSIMFVRGGELNDKGEYPNPHSLVGGVEQAVWVVSATGGAPRRIGEGHGPEVSPKGDRVAFVSHRQVWWGSIADSTAAEQLIRARGTARSLRWSPDGSKLAFVSDRGDHAFIAVYDVATKALRFLDPSVDSDGEPVWSPDGRRIAFLRIPAGAEGLPFTPQRSGQPWSIRVADVATGVGRGVWVADSGAGSVFREVVAANQLLWGAGDRIVFPWEKDGWTHLYTVPAAGGRATLLTPGGFEVEHVTLSPDRATVVFSSNQDDIERRHIWKVAVSGGPPTAVTKGTGLEWTPVVTGDGRGVAFIQAGTRTPPHPVLQVGSASPRDLAPGAIPAEFPEGALVDPQPVLFPAADGMTIHAQLFLPRGVKGGERRPAVAFFHGGSRRQMLLGWHYFYYYRNAYALNQYLASRGYVVLSVNYRSGIAYGMEFREALHYGAQGASEFNDVLGAGRYLRTRPDVDPKRIGSGSGVRPVRGGRRPSWRARLEHRDPELGAELRSREAGRRREARIRVVADRLREGLAVTGAADSWRRRPQCPVQPDGAARGGVADARCARGGAHLPGRDPRLPDACPLGRGVPGGRRLLRAHPRSRATRERPLEALEVVPDHDAAVERLPHRR